MLYKFKSQAAADVIMVDVHAKPILEAIGKSGPQGIVTVEQVPAAIAAIEAAIARDEQHELPPGHAHTHAHAHSEADHGDEPNAAEAVHTDRVSLRQRAAPFIDLLQRSAAEGKDVVWGV